MRRILVTGLGALMRLGATAGSAMAQDALEVKVPFSFLVSGQTLPAGELHHHPRQARPHPCYLIRGDKGNQGAFVRNRTLGRP